MYLLAVEWCENADPQTSQKNSFPSACVHKLPNKIVFLQCVFACDLSNGNFKKKLIHRFHKKMFLVCVCVSFFKNEIVDLFSVFQYVFNPEQWKMLICTKEKWFSLESLSIVLLQYTCLGKTLINRIL